MVMNSNKAIRIGNIFEAHFRARYEDLYRRNSDNRYEHCTLEAPLVGTPQENC